MSKSSQPERLNTYVSLMYELKKNGTVFRSKFVGTGPSSYEKRIYRATVSQSWETLIYTLLLREGQKGEAWEPYKGSVLSAISEHWIEN